MLMTIQLTGNRVDAAMKKFLSFHALCMCARIYTLQYKIDASYSATRIRE